MGQSELWLGQLNSCHSKLTHYPVFRRQTRCVMSRRNGFTLVELLVVIGIIALLISILLPALNKAREAAYTVACLSNERQIAQAIFMYADANKGSLPDAFNYAFNVPQTRWHGLILPYLGATFKPSAKTDVAVYLCPAHQSMRGPEFGTNLGTTGLSGLDYAVNYGAAGGLFAWTNYSGTPGSHSARMTQVRHPSNIFMLMDAGISVYAPFGAFSTQYIGTPYAPPLPNPYQWSLDLDYNNDGFLDTDSGWLNGNGSAPVPYNGAEFRHNKRVNVVFMDGHAAPLDVIEWAKREHWTW